MQLTVECLAVWIVRLLIHELLSLAAGSKCLHPQSGREHAFYYNNDHPQGVI